MPLSGSHLSFGLFILPPAWLPLPLPTTTSSSCLAPSLPFPCLPRMDILLPHIAVAFLTHLPPSVPSTCPRCCAQVTPWDYFLVVPVPDLHFLTPPLTVCFVPARSFLHGFLCLPPLLPLFSSVILLPFLLPCPTLCVVFLPPSDYFLWDAPSLPPPPPPSLAIASSTGSHLPTTHRFPLPTPATTTYLPPPLPAYSSSLGLPCPLPPFTLYEHVPRDPAPGGDGDGVQVHLALVPCARCWSPSHSGQFNCLLPSPLPCSCCLCPYVFTHAFPLPCPHPSPA